MTHGARGLRRAVPVLGLALSLSVLGPVQSADANEVLTWNEAAVNVTTANGQFAPVRARTLAMTQAAVHDALNAIGRRYDAYYFEGPGDPGASPGAAVAAAAHTVLVGVAQSLVALYWPEASVAVIFAVMAAVLLVRPQGLFGIR